MKRINTEESWFSDPRREVLISLLGGNKFIADGAALNAWRLAQYYWIPDRELIPIHAWSAVGIPKEFFDAGLAEMRQGGVYVRGTERWFNWWFEGIENKRKAGQMGGRISAQRDRDEKGRLLPKQVQAESKQSPSTSKPSSSSSSSKKKEYIRATGESCVTPARLVEIYNLNRGALPECRGLNAGRRNQARLRLIDQPSEEYWVLVFKRAAGSSFCRGDGGRGWRASFDWFLRPDTHLRVMEGKYDDFKPDEDPEKREERIRKERG